ncbi:MAG TPA: aldolase/citrate lyase family protein [Usitatibacter sp.]|nr:aldolase/citrate lyase family protein [Usitatibacter sp.]
MELPQNRFKRAIAAGRQQIGLWVSLASPYSTEVVAGSGFDWLLIDGEHSPNDPPTVLPQLQAAAPYPVTCIVRPAWNDKVLIKRYLDVGVQTLLVPYVQTAEEAREAVDAVRFPARGVRGVAGATRATGFGRIADYAARAADEICLLVQIETRQGLDNLEAIARTDGVDGVFIGPADLAAGLGHLGQQGHPEVQAAIQDAIKRIRACGKPAGILTPDEATARKYIEWGTTFTAVGLDIVLLRAESDKLAAKFKP